jgi:hypothetical protein
MPNVFAFIEEGLSDFSDKGILDKRLGYCCQKLNELLNNVTIDDYDEHLKINLREISKEIEDMKECISEILFVDLSRVLNLLRYSQRVKQIDERDHYYHSIQCFLLSIVLLEKTWPVATKVPDDIIAILYSMTMYHDIGYLYKSNKFSEDEVNKMFAGFFLCTNPLYIGDIEETLCLRTEKYQSSELITDIFEVLNGNDNRNIWLSESADDRILSENDIDLPIPVKHRKSHAYKSALILAKTIKTKEIIKNYYDNFIEVDTNYDKIVWFRYVLKAVYLHSFKSLSPLLNINDEFYSVYMMIIDELQTYGRQLPNNNNNDVLINPKDVGFHWDTVNPKLLEIDIITSDAKLIKKYNAHNSKEIWSILSKKIDENSLSSIIPRP